MKNFSIIFCGKEYWISRSVTVNAYIKGFDEKGTEYVLATKRGEKTPDFQGFWCLPCGYVDFDETVEQAIKREVEEETGLIRYEKDFYLVGINSNPKENNQNISIRFKTNALNIEKNVPNVDLIDKNEVEEVKWIKLKDIKEYNWAFNHLELIEKYIQDENNAV